MAALLRNAMGAPEPTQADINRMIDRDDAWRTSPVTRDRLVQINQLTQDFYAARFPGSWSQTYLIDTVRCRPRRAPARPARTRPRRLDQPRRPPPPRKGVTDTEMLTAGVARTASTGRLIDQFRDRITFPITNDQGEILGFVARRNPAAADDRQRRTEVPQHRRNPAVPQGRPVLRHPPCQAPSR